MITGLISGLIPLILKLVEFFVNRSNLNMDEKKSFLSYIKQANLIVKNSEGLRKSIDRQKDRLDELEKDKKKEWLPKK